MQKKLLSSLIGSIVIAPGTAQAGLTGADIVSGSGSIEQIGSQTIIRQTSDQIQINFTDFSIAANETVQFIQPSSSAIAINNVLGSNNPSLIFGNLIANGQIILINAGGINIASTANINVAGIVASTLQLINQDIQAGQFQFKRGDQFTTGKVVNEGNIVTAEGGFVILAGDYAENTGIVQAKLGNIVLASTQAMTLDLSGDGLVSFVVDKTAMEKLAGVQNMGTLSANGGQVVMTASVADNLVATAVRNDGLIEARSIVEHNGEIVLSGHSGDTINSGQLIATGDAEADGGSIQVLGDRAALIGDSIVDASGKEGGSILIGGDFQGKGDVKTSTFTQVDSAVTINADAVGSGDGGNVVVWSDGSTSFTGSISAKGGDVAGNGGSVEVSGKENLRFIGDVVVSAKNGSDGAILLDPFNIIIVDGIGGQQNNHQEVGDSSVLFSDGLDSTFFISEQALENLSGTVILQADNDITIENLLDNTLSFSGASAGTKIVLQAGRNITFTDVSDAIVTSGGSIHLEGGSPHSNIAGNIATLSIGNLITGQGAGDVTIIGGDITIQGDIIEAANIFIGSALSAGSDGFGLGAQNITASSVTLNSNRGQLIASGDLNITASTVTLNSNSGLLVASGDLNIAADNLVISSAFTANGDNVFFSSFNSPIAFNRVQGVDIRATNNVTFSGGINAEFTIIDVTAEAGDIILNGDSALKPVIFTFSAGQDIVQNGALDLEQGSASSNVNFNADRDIVINGDVLANQVGLELGLFSGRDLIITGSTELKPEGRTFGEIPGNLLARGTTDVTFSAGRNISLADILLSLSSDTTAVTFDALAGGVSFGSIFSDDPFGFDVAVNASGDFFFATIANNGGSVNLDGVQGGINTASVATADAPDVTDDIPNIEDIFTPPEVVTPDSGTSTVASSNTEPDVADSTDPLTDAIVAGEDPTTIQEAPAAGEEEVVEIALKEQPLIEVSSTTGNACAPK